MSLLQTEELAAGYGDFQALFGVSLAIEPGETIAIIGANGAGKSTLLRTICGLLRSRRPTEGYPHASEHAGYNFGGAASLGRAHAVGEGAGLDCAVSVRRQL